MTRLIIDILDEEHARTIREKLDEWQAEQWIRYRQADSEPTSNEPPARLHYSAKEAERSETLSVEEIKIRLGISD